MPGAGDTLEIGVMFTTLQTRGSAPTLGKTPEDYAQFWSQTSRCCFTEHRKYTKRVSSVMIFQQGINFLERKAMSVSIASLCVSLPKYTESWLSLELQWAIRSWALSLGSVTSLPTREKRKNGQLRARNARFHCWLPLMHEDQQIKACHESNAGTHVVHQWRWPGLFIPNRVFT